MPFYNGTLFQINEKEMLRYAGMNPSSKDFPPEEVSSAVREALALAEPRGCLLYTSPSPRDRG